MKGRRPSENVHRHFQRIEKPPGETDRAICKFCKWQRAYHTTELRKHLQYDCTAFQEWEERQPGVSGQLVKQSRIERSYSILTTQRREQIRRGLARAVYLDNLPFTAFEKGKALNNAIHLIHPEIQQPSPKVIRGQYLDLEYDEIKAKVDGLITTEQYLNITADESTNITTSRIITLCANLYEKGSFFLTSHDCSGDKVSSEYMCEFIRKQLHTLVDPEGKLTTLEQRIQASKRVNSIAFDTCEGQLKAFRLIKQVDELQHVFFVPCESHGLQLLVKDLIERVPSLKATFNDVQRLATAFSTSPKQLGKLRQVMQKVLGRQYSFTLAVITRWGTQLRLLTSVQRIRYAIQEFFEKADRGDLGEKLTEFHSRQIHYNKEFWGNLDFISELLQPLHDAIKMSEDDRSVIGYVIPRWKELRAHFKSKVEQWRVRDPQLGDIDEQIFKPRYQR